MVSEYQVRAIRDAEMTELGAEILFASDDLAEARAAAVGESIRAYGAAIVDTQAGTIDWGHAVTRIGEPAPALDVD